MIPLALPTTRPTGKTVMMEPQIPGYRVQQNSLRFYNILSLPSNVLATIIRFLSPPFAMLFRRMFQKWHRIDHLETSIRFSVLALSATSQSHPRLAHYQQRLAVSLRDRYRKLGKIWDLRCAILLQKSALTNVLAGDPDLSWHQQNLVVSYHALCSRFGKLEDMNTTLELQHRIYSTLRDDDPTRSWWMRNIATTYQGLHIYTGDMDNLESGIYWANMSLDNTPDGDEDLPERQLVLAALLMDRSKTSNNISDMDRAIELDCAALEATPKGTIEHALCAMSLVSSYGIRYGQFKTPGDLESALRLSEQTINDMPQDTNYYPQFSHAASEQYLHKHRKDNDTADLHKALRHSKNAVAATPSGRPSSGVYKGHLSVIYLDYYHRFGSMSDLELAIDINISALALLPEGHVRMPFQQLHMSLLYYSQCLRHRDAQVLERALHWGGLARQGTSKKDSLYLHCLHNLGLLYHLKFQISQDVKDLDNAVDMMREAIDATPPNGPDLPVRYSTMANLYASRYQFLGGRETRDESLKWMRAAVDAAERLGDPELPARQNALAVQLFNNYIRLREEQDLESALQLSLSATAETPDDSAVGASRFSTLAGIYAEKYALEHREDLRDLTLKTFRHASGFTGSNPDSQWQLARKWVMFADSVPSPEALDAYAFAFNIIPTLLWLGSNITTRHEALVKYDISGMASNAVVSCIENENYGLAVEFLEQNLSITFNQLLDLQTDLSLLSENHSDLAQGLGSISAELRQLAIATGDPNEVGDKTSSITSDKTRKLALERDTLLQQIRDLPGFEHFLLPIPFSKLRQAAIHGPIVMISCTSHRCDALILTNTDAPVLHLRLFRVNTKILHVQRQRLKKALESLGIHARDLRDGDRAGRIAQRQRAPEGTMLDEVLEWLWTFVVSPIYGLLKNNGITAGRLWWCPTGPLVYLPLHAAGPPNKFIPSYTSTLNGLIRSRSHQLKAAVNSKLTVIGISESPEGKFAPLPNVIKEIKVIKESAPNVSILANKEASSSKVSVELPSSEWLHLACHGQQGDSKDPLSSCLLLYDGKLYLKQLLSTPLPNADFVFLSACETAMGDTTMSNESLHLAGGMLFAGFKAAIATLWSINDDDGPLVARVVYEHLFQTDTERTVANSAEALQKAVDHLRGMGIPAHRWVPFIHIGI